MDIDHLIQQLAERAQPVTRLLAPWRRAVLWLAASLGYVGIVVVAYLLADGGLPGSIEPRLVLELAAILATATTAAIAALPAGAMLLMLRRGAPLLPAVSLALGVLATGAMANLGLRIFHAADLSIQILVWHGGGAFVVAMIASLAGPRVLQWRTWADQACDA